MTVFAFVRNIMIGREGMTASFLLNTLVDCGATSPISFLSTGNFVFNLLDRELGAFEADCAGLISQKLGRVEPVFCRSLAHISSLIASQPFQAHDDPAIHERCISFLSQAPTPSLKLPMVSKRGDVEIFRFAELEAFSTTRMINGRTSSAGALLEPALGSEVTTRNWNTVIRLHAKVRCDA